MSCLGLLLALAGGTEPVRVARLEVSVPGHSPFLLHGTLPLPREAELGPDGLPALYVENHDAPRTHVPAQVEIVSRAPDGRPDVIELLARVELGAQERKDARCSYSILLGPAVPEPPFRALPQVEALLARGAHNLRLRTQDVRGNVYLADLGGDAVDKGFGSLRLNKDGRWLRELRLAATLAPAPSPEASGAPLPHLMGVHAYVRARAEEEVVSLDLRVHNGCTSGSRPPTSLEEPLGAVYWRSLELLVPREWNVIPEIADPFFGGVYEEGPWRVVPLVKALPEGRLHLMPPQAQFERRLVLIPAGKGQLGRDELAHDGLGFAQPGPGLWSWSAPECPRWLAQRAPLPQLDFFRRGAERGNTAVRAMEGARAAEYAQALAQGKPHGWYMIANVMGWAHPWFLHSESGFGGEGLALNEGASTAASASREGYRHLELLHRMNVCRQSEAAWTREGEPAGYHAWLDGGGRIPFEFRPGAGLRPPCFRLPWERGAPASEQVREVVRRELRPPYDMGNWYEPDGSVPERSDNLLSWSPHDEQHLLRYTKQAKALVWLGNDSLAKDDLLLSGELFHLAFHESRQAEGSPQGATLRALESLVQAHPHQGLPIGRELAWGIDAACAAYSVAAPPWRERNRDWLRRVATLLCDAALPSGILQRTVNPRVLGHERYTVTQTSESFYLIHALRCLDQSVLRGSDERLRQEVDALALRAVDFLFFGPPFQRIAAEGQRDPRRPGVYVQGPRWGFAISKNDDYKTPPFADLPLDGWGGGIEGTHGLWVLEWARELSDRGSGLGLDNRYMRRALEYGVPHKDFEALARELEEQSCEFSRDNSVNWAPFLAALQQLGVK